MSWKSPPKKVPVRCRAVSPSECEDEAGGRKRLVRIGEICHKPNFRTSEKDDRRIYIAIAKWSQRHFSQSCFHFNFFGQNCQVHSETWLETLNGQKVIRVTQQGLHLYSLLQKSRRIKHVHS